MPIYTYKCNQCEKEFEHLIPMEDRDTVKLVCGKCHSRLIRIIDKPPYLAGEKYQMKAILGDGSKVSGHFGKSAPLQRKK
jgi:putative FmdB family regulatory protein